MRYIDKPVLSILIPTYNYLIGLKRNLYFVKDAPLDKCEFIIFDNSPGFEISQYMKSWIENHKNINIKYQLNRPITTPPDNWNNLIDCASGQYCLLLHNGEIPEDSSFFSRLVEKLEKHEPDLALLNCILLDLNKNDAYVHLPMWIRSLVIKWNPQYIFQQNIIGPTSTIVIRKKLYAQFDNKLDWLLDVDSYYRSIIIAEKKDFYKDLSILSIFENDGTLTAKIRTKVKEIELKERSYLSKKYKNIFWNNSCDGWKFKILCMLEKIVWKSFTKINRILQYNLINKIKDSLSEVWQIE